MIIELEMLQAKVAQVPGFPVEMKTLLEHLIISHHGHYEFGSPKLPMFPEALMLHYLDDLDSKMESMRAQFERDAGSGDGWSGYNPSLARPLLDSRRLLERLRTGEDTVVEVATAQVAADSAPVDEPVRADVHAPQSSAARPADENGSEGSGAPSQQQLLELERRFARPQAGESSLSEKAKSGK
jgi:3'-5' exoribonuclease